METPLVLMTPLVWFHIDPCPAALQVAFLKWQQEAAIFPPLKIGSSHTSGGVVSQGFRAGRDAHAVRDFLLAHEVGTRGRLFPHTAE